MQLQEVHPILHVYEYVHVWNEQTKFYSSTVEPRHNDIW